MKRRKGVKIKLANGEIITRVPKAHAFGNFQMMTPVSKVKIRLVEVKK